MTTTENTVSCAARTRWHAVSQAVLHLNRTLYFMSGPDRTVAFCDRINIDCRSLTCCLDHYPIHTKYFAPEN